MENLGGLDEVKVKENKTEETVVSLEEKKAKRKPFHYWEVNSRQFRLKLKASTVGKLENKYHQNIRTIWKPDTAGFQNILCIAVF